ncbi:MAG: hypothetical protein ABEI99_02360 [Halobaculum sp.]
MGVVSQRQSGDTDGGLEAELFEVLSNQRRRFAVYAVSGEEEVELGTLAKTIAAWENEQPVEQVTSDERKRVYTALQQSHLPKLAEAGLIDYDDRAGLVRPRPELEEYDVYMEVVGGREIPWSEYYLGLSGVAAALTAAVWVGAWPFAALPDVAWLTAVVVAFTVSAAAHTYLSRGTELGADGTPPEVDIEE